MSVAFGTSGLRGEAEGFTPELCAAYVAAFLDLAGATPGPKRVYVGADLRESSPRIAAACLAAARAMGWEPVYAGCVPTPALAVFALAHSCPAVMVTGSHIPAHYNGIKFYRREGELLKEDETPIRDAALARLAAGGAVPAAELPDPDPEIGRSYVARYRQGFAGDALSGLKIGVLLHSAVGGDLLVEILEGLGAQCVPFGRAERFVAVDTEALSPDMLAMAQEKIAASGLDAVVSTDGDGDRPLVLDDAGRQINGDVLCALAARALGITTIVTPLTSTSAIDMSGWFEQVWRTRIGSPYVVAEMARLGMTAGVAGFEANGGFLLGNDIETGVGRIAALPTRDAVLPVLAVLAEARRRDCTLHALPAELPARFMRADRVRNVPREAGTAFLTEIVESARLRGGLLAELAVPADVDQTDGIRFTLSDGRIVHFRQSGNAPELRCYVETGHERETATLLAALMAKLETYFASGVREEEI